MTTHGSSLRSLALRQVARPPAPRGCRLRAPAAKRPEEREFYLGMAARERWSKRELERRLRLGVFERAALDEPRLSPVARARHGSAADVVFKDTYVVGFLDLPPFHSEAELHHGRLIRSRAFLTELGRDFCFVGSESPIQAGGRDFALDLVFFHRASIACSRSNRNSIGSSPSTSANSASLSQRSIVITRSPQ